MNTQCQPDWSFWANMADAQLWQAVALSMGYEPSRLPGYQARPIIGSRFDECPEEFRLRLQTACSHVTKLELTSIVVGSGPELARVTLQSVRDWATTLPYPWVFPIEYPTQVNANQLQIGALENKTGVGSEGETTLARRKRRYETCVAANLVMPDNDYARLPRGIGKLANKEGVSRQAFAEDVKAYIRQINGK